MSARNSTRPAVVGSSKRTPVKTPQAPDSAPVDPLSKSESYKPEKKSKKQPADGKKKQSKQRKAKKRKKKPVKRKILEPGSMVKSAVFKWEVKRKLGSGGFGDVYKVAKVENLDKKEYAMKTEMVAGEKRMLRLKIEVSVLEQCQAAEPGRRKHFVEYVDKGMCADQFKFVVMGLVGPSIEDIRIKILEDNYSPEAAMNIAFQTLKSIDDLHHIGWLHRDIKPQNFAVGLDDAEATIFMLDFGIARSIFNTGTRVPKTPRAKVKFLGTIRFASRACHKSMDQGRKDDLETWLYMVVDLFDARKGLPWKRRAKEEVLKLKERFFKKKSEFRKEGSLVPKELWVVADYINKLKYHDEPDYMLIGKALDAVAADNKIDWKQKAEWIGRREDSESSSSSEPSTDNKQSGSASDTTGASEKKVKSKMKKVSHRKKAKEGTKDATKENTKEATKEATIEKTKENTKEATKEFTKENTKEGTRESKEAIKPIKSGRSRR